MLFKAYIIALGIFIILDTLWIGFVANNFYKSQIGHLLSANVNWPAAIVFYLLFTVAILIFVIVPGIERHSLMYTVLSGVFLGLVSYATYDLTNFATLKNWTLAVTIVDILWGAFLTGLVSTLTYLVTLKFFV